MLLNLCYIYTFLNKSKVIEKISGAYLEKISSLTFIGVKQMSKQIKTNKGGNDPKTWHQSIKRTNKQVRSNENKELAILNDEKWEIRRETTCFTATFKAMR